MKVIGICGSPREKGSTTRLIKAVLDGAKEAGHKTKFIHLYGKDIKACKACRKCTEGKVKYCVHKDDLTALFPEIFGADVLVLGSPVFFGHLTGTMKIFVDRLYTCIKDHDFNVRHIDGKKLVTIVTSGAPPKVYADVAEYLRKWFCDFLKLRLVKHLSIGNLHDDGSLDKQAGALEKAHKIGASL